jgi:hypothetical protein
LGRVLALPGLCELYFGILNTTEEITGENSLIVLNINVGTMKTNI